LAFYNFPAENWQHNRTKNCGSRNTTLAMAFKLVATTQKKWKRLRSYKHLADVITGVTFTNGIKEDTDQQQDTA
jgi:hypothetical protein